MLITQLDLGEGHLLWLNWANIGKRAELIASRKSEAEGRSKNRLPLHKQEPLTSGWLLILQESPFLEEAWNGYVSLLETV